MSDPTVVVVGLGPAGPELMTTEAVETIARVPVRVVRTRRHPAAGAVPDASDCDDLYDSSERFEDVYAAIVDRLAALAAREGEVVYAVPGSPFVLEQTCRLLEREQRLRCRFVAGVSFLDLAWPALGIDPVEAGVRLVDGHTFATSAAGERGPMLVAHCHNQRVLSDIKLATDEPGDTPVVVLQRLGLVDQQVSEVAWADLDREVAADHLTSLYIPRLASPVAGELMRFQELVHTLRRECPWDREQTHASLRRHLIEEAYEVLEAIDHFDPASGNGADDLEEELGDLLFQVFLHSIMAAETGWFDLADVARTVHDKLYERHPHVFGDAEVSGTAELVVSWEAQKVAEKGRDSVLDGVPPSLPALSLAEKTLKKATAVGSPEPSVHLRSLAARLAAVAADPTDTTVGAALLSLVELARTAGIDPEMALRAELRKTATAVRRHENP